MKFSPYIFTTCLALIHSPIAYAQTIDANEILTNSIYDHYIETSQFENHLDEMAKILGRNPMVSKDAVRLSKSNARRDLKTAFKNLVDEHVEWTVSNYQFGNDSFNERPVRYDSFVVINDEGLPEAEVNSRWTKTASETAQTTTTTGYTLGAGYKYTLTASIEAEFGVKGLTSATASLEAAHEISISASYNFQDGVMNATVNQTEVSNDVKYKIGSGQCVKFKRSIHQGKYNIIWTADATPQANMSLDTVIKIPLMNHTIIINLPINAQTHVETERRENSEFLQLKGGISGDAVSYSQASTTLLPNDSIECTEDAAN